MTLPRKGASRGEIERVARAVEKVETAVEPRFQDHFVEALAIPHRTQRYPRLAEAVRLPARAADEGGGPARRRRRRVAAPPGGGGEPT